MVIRMDLPGIKVEDVKVSVIDGQLVVKGERRQKSEVKDDDYYRMEASYGAFERRFPLGDEVGDDDVKASAADGVLEITLPAPKSELETNAKEILIATGSSN